MVTNSILLSEGSSLPELAQIDQFHGNNAPSTFPALTDTFTVRGGKLENIYSTENVYCFDGYGGAFLSTMIDNISTLMSTAGIEYAWIAGAHGRKLDSTTFEVTGLYVSNEFSRLTTGLTTRKWKVVSTGYLGWTFQADNTGYSWAIPKFLWCQADSYNMTVYKLT